MSPPAVDRLNLGLMVAALVAAFAAPFELFLLAYAVLGPLHYLTEIGWLAERRFFTRGKHDWLVLAGLLVLAVAGARFVFGSHHVEALAPFGPALLFAAFGCALVFASFDRAVDRTVGAAAVVVLAAAFAGVVPRAWVLFSTLLTTIVHVSLFTGAFMLYGALKARSGWGHAAFAGFVACSLVALLAPAHEPALASEYVRTSYASFASLNVELLKLLGGRGDGREVYASAAGVAVMRFIAFAYAYHYLNWFSKTSIIRWHAVDKRKLVLAVAVWIASLALYATSYELGARWLFLLSFAHVVLEFPLNHVAFAGIAKELAARVRERMPGTA